MSQLPEATDVVVAARRQINARIRMGNHDRDPSHIRLRSRQGCGPGQTPGMWDRNYRDEPPMRVRRQNRYAFGRAVRALTS